VTDQQRIRRERQNLRHDVRQRQRAEFGIQQLHVVAIVDQRPADRQQAERRQMLVRDAAADRWMPWIDQQDPHVLLHLARGLCVGEVGRRWGAGAARS
jgi:hypothetical protein